MFIEHLLLKVKAELLYFHTSKEQEMDQELAAAVAGIENQRKMGLHLLWYVPACLLVVLGIVVPVGILAFENVRPVLHAFSWVLLVSPSFYVFCSMTICSIGAPIALLSHIPELFANSDKKASSVLVGFGMILLWTVVFQVVIWGSYPIGYDAHGIGHTRLIPFLPWPHESL